MSKPKVISKMELSTLKPFHGYQTSIIPLPSGYYFYLASWDSNPTAYPQFSNIWLITPEDKRILFSDPPAISGIVSIYHDFHEIYAASIGIEWDTENHLHVECKSINSEFDLDVRMDLVETLGSRLLVAIGASPPTPFMTSQAMVAFSNFLVNTFLARSGSTVAGRTETDQPFYHGLTERLLRVVGGSSSLNGVDLGSFTSPTWPIEFGDAVPFFHPIIKLGTMYIPFRKDMVAAAD